VNIVAFLKDHGVPYELSGKNLSKGRVGLCCVFCHDTGFHGSFTADGQIYYCWKCGWHSAQESLQRLTGLSYFELATALMEYDGASQIGNIARKQAQGTTIELPGGELKPVHRQYLEKRGFDPDILEAKHGFKGTGIAGEFKYRIIIPIEFEGKTVSFTSRDYTGQQELRYKTLSVEKSVVDPKNLLYNHTLAVQESVMVAEGPFDALKLGDGAVATLGTSVTEAQVRKIAAYKKVFIIFDPEAPAIARAIKLAERVAVLGVDAEILIIGGNGDPGSMDREAVLQLRKELGFSTAKECFNWRK